LKDLLLSGLDKLEEEPYEGFVNNCTETGEPAERLLGRYRRKDPRNKGNQNQETKALVLI